MSKTKILPLDELKALPSCGRNDAGVYFLWRDDELLYIGQSKNIRNRLQGHRKNVIPYTRHTFLKIDYLTLGWSLIPVESDYIGHYSPPHNIKSTAAWNAARKWA